MSLKIAFLMDPLAGLALKKDSTLAMIRAAQQRGWQVSYLEQGDLVLQEHEPHGMLRSLQLSSPFVERLRVEDAGSDWYQLGPAKLTHLGELDIIMMRKDPPFDMAYIYSTYFLERAEGHGVAVINKPQGLRDCNEKFFATAFPACCPPLVVSSSEQVLREFHASHKNVVFKPLDGMGGQSVFCVMEGDQNLGVIIETLTNGGANQIMGQKYIPQITDGDKRILMIDGEPIPYALARIPMKGEARANLAAGGTGEGRELTERDRWIATQVGPELKRRGLTFVGIDVIGDYLTEVNVTCPTCIRELDAQFALDIGGTLLDTIAAKLDAQE